MAQLTRRLLLKGFAASAAAANARNAATAAGDQLSPSAAANQPAIVFVHGNGGRATSWLTQFWRFESNGYDRKRLFAIQFTNPIGANPPDYGKPHPGRSTWGEALIELAMKVEEVKQLTGEGKLVLVGHSRGCNPIRSYIKNANGAASVSKAILCAGVNHGAYTSDAPEWMLSEFNGWGYFLRQLNHGPAEATEGVKFLTIRSDNDDAWAQPVVYAASSYANGRTGIPSNVGYEGPALTGATNVVLPAISHNGCGRSPLAFREMYRFITETEPERLDVAPESDVILDGMVTGRTGGLSSNLPLAGATLDIFEVSPATGERLGPAVHSRATGVDGRWGPFAARPSTYYEFVLIAPGYPVQHVYRQPFPRSSAILHWRVRGLAESDKGAAASVIVLNTGGDALYRGRDTVLIDDKVPPDLQPGPNDENEVKTQVDATDVRGARATLNDQQLTVRTWLARDNHIVVADFLY
jgi:pimeloyl-ACP methyl ester carboxylesterase